jgi:hypothetical protein
MPERARRYVDLLIAERGSQAYAVRDILSFLERRWTDFPLQLDGVRCCPYFGAISYAIEDGFDRAGISGGVKTVPFRLWYMEEIGQPVQF